MPRAKTHPSAPLQRRLQLELPGPGAVDFESHRDASDWRLIETASWSRRGNGWTRGITRLRIRLVDQAAQLDPDFALVAYRRAECLAAAGNLAEARNEYQRARDLDGCRFRAPSAFRQIVQQVATAPGRTDCHYLDVEQILDDLSLEAAPGNDFFLEHVHFNFDGHREVARAVAQTIVRQVLNLTWNDDRVPSDGQIAIQVGVTVFDTLEASGHAMTVLSTSPFKNAPDSRQNLERPAGAGQRLLQPVATGGSAHVCRDGSRPATNGYDQRSGRRVYPARSVRAGLADVPMCTCRDDRGRLPPMWAWPSA